MRNVIALASLLIVAALAQDKPHRFILDYNNWVVIIKTSDTCYLFDVPDKAKEFVQSPSGLGDIERLLNKELHHDDRFTAGTDADLSTFSDEIKQACAGVTIKKHIPQTV